MIKPQLLLRSAGMVLIAAALLGVLRSGARAQQGAAAEIKIDNFSFTPVTITVSAGTTVTWTTGMTFPTRSPATTTSSSQKPSTRTRSFLANFPRPELTPTSVLSTPR